MTSWLQTIEGEKAEEELLFEWINIDKDNPWMSTQAIWIMTSKFYQEILSINVTHYQENPSAIRIGIMDTLREIQWVTILLSS